MRNANFTTAAWHLSPPKLLRFRPRGAIKKKWFQMMIKVIVRSFVACLTLNLLSAAHAADYEARGLVAFANLQATLQFDGTTVAPYAGKGISRQLGWNCQSGAILPTPDTVSFNPVTGTLTFSGVQGPNPLYGGQAVHVIETAHGRILCTWVADFTAQFSADGQKVVLSGDGIFTVVGGTQRYRGATGQFRTLFRTGEVPATADIAVASWTESGQISTQSKK